MAGRHNESVNRQLLKLALRSYARLGFCQTLHHLTHTTLSTTPPVLPTGTPAASPAAPRTGYAPHVYLPPSSSSSFPSSSTSFSPPPDVLSALRCPVTTTTTSSFLSHPTFSCSQFFAPRSLCLAFPYTGVRIEEVRVYYLRITDALPSRSFFSRYCIFASNLITLPCSYNQYVL